MTLINRSRLFIFALLMVLVLALSSCAVAGRLLDGGANVPVESTPAGELLSDGPAAGNGTGEGATDAALQGEGTMQPAQLPGVVAALEGTLAQIYEEVSPSVVHIRHALGEGSGFVWDTAGHIVSNNHVVAGAQQVLVTFADGTTTEATIVGTDADSDLAVLRVNLPPEQLRPVRLADSTQLRVGELAVAIGNPFGQEGTMTVGIISALGRRINVENSLYNIPDVIQTDAAINPGNSGGVLLNPEGEVIGVTSAIISPVRASSGVGFAIPSVIVQRVVTSLIETGSFQHPYMGITGGNVTVELAQQRGLPAGQRGALLVSVVPGSPAAAAGLRGHEINGDIVVAIDGAPINGIDSLITYLARHGSVGQTVMLTILRDGQTLEVPLTLGPRPG